MRVSDGAGTTGKRRRIWVQQVAVDTYRLEMQVDAARARGDLTGAQEVVAVGVDGLIHSARAAAFRDDPVPSRLSNWWRGVLVEAAYRNVHTAQAALIDLYTYDELQAEAPVVVARANATLHRDDPRRMTVAELKALPKERLRPRMRRLVGDSYDQLDLQQAQLRSFRNIILMAAVFLVLAVGVTLFAVIQHPGWIPLCFNNSGSVMTCPTTSGAAARPTWPDIVVIAGLGSLGGALAATLAIRNLKGSSTPYDVPVALAALKVPMGALTAILGLVAIKGDFVPGLSNLDNQGQILAYALLFGFGQQALTRLLDRRAQDLLEGLPGGDSVAPLPGSKGEPTVPPGSPPAGGQISSSPDPVSHPAADPAAEVPGDAAADVGAAAGAATETGKNRPVGEPQGALQQDQFDQLRETGNERHDMSEDEEAALLRAEFGAPDDHGIYGAPPDGGHESAEQEAH